MTTRTSRAFLVGPVLTLAAVLVLPASSYAQRGSRGGSMATVASSQSRLDTLDKSFELTKDQKNAIKKLLDEAYKNAAPIREGLTKTHAAIGAAVQGGKDQAEIDATAKSYAEQSAAMASLEMKALADIVKLLTEPQRANNAAISAAFFMLRGAFVGKKWDDIPEGRVRY